MGPQGYCANSLSSPSEISIAFCYFTVHTWQSQLHTLCQKTHNFRPCVTFVSSVKTNKHIFKFFSPSGSQAILIFPYQTAWQYSDGNPPGWGVECRWGRQKSRFWANIWLHCQLSTLRPRLGVVNTPPPNRDKLWHIAGSKRRRLLFTGDVDDMFMTRSLNVTHLTARSDKYVAYVTNNKRLRSTFCTIEAKLLTDTKQRAASLQQLSDLFHLTTILPFLRYWTSNNGVPLKFGLLFKNIQNGTIR